MQISPQLIRLVDQMNHEMIFSIKLSFKHQLYDNNILQSAPNFQNDDVDDVKHLSSQLERSL